MISTFNLAAPRENSLTESTQKLQGRSRLTEAHQLNLLALLEKPQKPALRIEATSANVTVGNSERFCLIHQESGLRIPGQFSYYEAQEVLVVSEKWDWELLDFNPRTPRCSYRLLCLLNRVCTPQKALEVAV